MQISTDKYFDMVNTIFGLTMTNQTLVQTLTAIEQMLIDSLSPDGEIRDQAQRALYDYSVKVRAEKIKRISGLNQKGDNEE